MIVKLSDWLCIRWETEQCIDVIAQLLEFPREQAGPYLNPEAFVLAFEEETPRFGELRLRKAASGFAPGLAPAAMQQTEADDVFVTGLMLYRLLTGKLPDMSMAQFLMVKVHGRQPVPLLHAEQSALGELLERMTDLNPVTRITKQEALDHLAARWQGSVAIRIVEAETGTLLDRIDLPLKQSVTVWKPGNSLRFGDQSFVPIGMPGYRFPYRACPQTRTLTVQPQRSELRLPHGLHLPAYALDLGSTRIRLLRLSGENVQQTLLTVPTVSAFLSPDTQVFGKEAMRLQEAGTAGFIRCSAEERPETITAADGSAVRISPQEAALALMRHLYTQACRLGMAEGTELTATCGCDEKTRAFWVHTAEEAGFRLRMLPDVSAMLLAYSLEELPVGDLMMISAGAGAVNVSAIRCGKGLGYEKLAAQDPAKLQCSSAPGGGELTDYLVRDMLQTLDLHYGLSLYRQENSHLNAAQFTADRERIEQAAESIKRVLSFTEQADTVLSLYDGTAEPLEVKTRYTQQQLVALAEPICRRLRHAMQQACANNGLTREEIGTVLVTGSASLSPALRRTISAYFQDTLCRIHYMDHADTNVRGAAVCSALLGSLAPTLQGDRELPYDLGIIAADAVQELPQFQTLLPAGTPLRDGAVCRYPLTVTQSDLTEDGSCRLRLYRRARGMEHIRSTLDPEGSCIRILGSVRITLPDSFRMESDRLEVHFTVLPDETIRAQALPLTASKRGFLNRKADPSEPIPAVFEPLA